MKFVFVENRGAPKEKLMADTFALADRIASKSPLVLKLLKCSLLHCSDMPLSAVLLHEQAMLALAFDTKDAHEGCSAFLGMRKPHFTGQ